MSDELSFLERFFNPDGGAAERLRKVIDKDFKDGLDETTVINSLILSASAELGKPLNQREIDIIRMHVINEKVKLRQEGRLKD